MALVGVECKREMSDFLKERKVGKEKKYFWVDDGHDSGPNQILSISFADSAVFRNAPTLPRA